MYDQPGARHWTDMWWHGIARHLRMEGLSGVPSELNRSLGKDDGWRAESLLFSQTCGYPLVAEYRDVLRPLLTPHYAVLGCSGPLYRSLLVVREADPRRDLQSFRGSRCAINGTDSQSGFNAMRHALHASRQPPGFFREVITAGVHAASIRLVAENRADICAIDCVTYAMQDRYDPQSLAGTRVMGQTAPSPGLLYVTAMSRSEQEVAALQRALARAFADDVLEPVRRALFLVRGEAVLLEDYDILLERERAALALGFDPMDPAAVTKI